MYASLCCGPSRCLSRAQKGDAWEAEPAQHVQGYVDLQLICTFTRMMEALGISKEKGKASITPEIISQVGHDHHHGVSLRAGFTPAYADCAKPSMRLAAERCFW